jgi:hypothetical protein
MPVLACPKLANACTCSATLITDVLNVATFAHTVRTKANAIKFAHQSLCSPRISTFLKALRQGFLKGCPNLTSAGVTRYLNHSPASSKGHMKRPHQGIRSTRPRLRGTGDRSVVHEPQHPEARGIQDHISNANEDDTSDSNASSQLVPRPRTAHVIEDDDTEIQGNLFCFGAFADRHTGVVYSDLTGTFPYMSLEGSVCFFVVYHYESNAILALPIPNMEDSTIYDAYKKII